MKKEIGMRESLAMRAQARAVLERLMPVFGHLGKHFKGSHRAQAGVQFMERLKDLTHRVHRTPAGVPVVMGMESFEFIQERFKGLSDVGYRIMESIAKDTPINESDLDILTQILNEEKR